MSWKSLQKKKKINVSIPAVSPAGNDSHYLWTAAVSINPIILQKLRMASHPPLSCVLNLITVTVCVMKIFFSSAFFFFCFLFVFFVFFFFCLFGFPSPVFALLVLWAVVLWATVRPAVCHRGREALLQGSCQEAGLLAAGILWCVYKATKFWIFGDNCPSQVPRTWCTPMLLDTV